MRQLILSCSLSRKSRSAILAGALSEQIAALGDEVELLDLREMQVPFCDAEASFGHPDAVRLRQAVEQASAVVLATPIYNFEVGGATRNVVAMVGQSFTGKVVGFACAAGGQGSYMAIMGLANSLMLDFRCVVVPRFVYVTNKEFDGAELRDDQVRERIVELAAELHRFGTALAPA